MNLELAKKLEPLAELVDRKRDLYYKEGGYEYEKKLEELKKERPVFSDSVSELASHSVEFHPFSLNPFSRIEKVTIPANIPNFHLTSYDKIHYKRFLRFPKFIKALGIILLILGIFLFGFSITGDEMAIPKPEFLQNDDPSTLTGPIVVCMILGTLIATIGIILLIKLKTLKGNQEARYCSAHSDGRNRAYEQDFAIYKKKEDALKKEYQTVLQNTKINEQQIREFINQYPIPENVLYPAAIRDMIEALQMDQYSTLEDALKWQKLCESVRESETKEFVRDIHNYSERVKEKRHKEFERQYQIHQLDRTIDELKELNKKLDELDKK